MTVLPESFEDGSKILDKGQCLTLFDIESSPKTLCHNCGEIKQLEQVRLFENNDEIKARLCQTCFSATKSVNKRVTQQMCKEPNGCDHTPKQRQLKLFEENLSHGRSR